MSNPSQQQSDPLAMLATMVANLDKRMTKLERLVYTAAGATAGASGGTWITIVMTRR